MLNVWVSKVPLKLGVGSPEIGGRTPEFTCPGKVHASGTILEISCTLIVLIYTFCEKGTPNLRGTYPQI